MGHDEELEKWGPGADAQGLPASRVRSKESAINEALDAEANVEPQITGIELVAEKTSDPGPPPNGGFAAWLQVLGSFFLFFNGWLV